jgi:hypothetical protein
MPTNRKPAVASGGPQEIKMENSNSTILPQSNAVSKRLNFYDWLMQHRTRGPQRDFVEDSKGEEKYLSSVRTFDDLYMAMCGIRRGRYGRYIGAGCTEAIDAGKKLIRKYRAYLLDTGAVQ